MKQKKFFSMLCLIAILIISTASASSNVKIKVNGNYIASDTAPFIINSCTYVPVRFVSEALNAEKVAWDAENNSVTIKKGSDIILLFVNKNYAYVNSQYTQLENNALLVNSRTFVPLRFISECFNADVAWDESSNTVVITTTSENSSQATTSRASIHRTESPTPTPTSSDNSVSASNASIVYNYEDAVYWLSRIIEAEAGAEPLRGKIAVGEVILNRAKSNEFPNTIWGVIFDSKFGIQFEPISNGTIYNTPSAESISAAKTALSGSNYVGNCLYFMNPRIASSSWISKNRQYYTTISNHVFYL